MNLSLLIAGLLCLLLGIAHSIIGEVLIFHEKRRKGKLVPTKSEEGMKSKHLGIIWATWHLTTFFGWAFGAILIKLFLLEESDKLGANQFIITSIIISAFAAGLLVLVATKGKHPGWIVLLAISALLFFGN